MLASGPVSAAKPWFQLVIGNSWCDRGTICNREQPRSYLCLGHPRASIVTVRDSETVLKT